MMRSLEILIIIFHFYLQVVDSALSPREVLNTIRASEKACFTDPTKKLKDVKESDKCPMKHSTYFSCFGEQRKDTVVWVTCSKWYFFTRDKHPLRCNKNAKWEKFEERKYCERLPSKLLEARRQELFLYEFKASNNLTKREFEKAVEYRKHLERIDRMELVLSYIDFIVCVIGFITLLYLIPVDNERMILHKNLIASFAFRDFLMILKIEEFSRDGYRCSIIAVCLQYFLLCQVCWMFNEGLYQVRNFFFVFVQNSYMWAYFIFGWVFPAFWTFAIFLPIIRHHPPSRNFRKCWHEFSIKYNANLVIYIPALLLLMLNMLMMIYMMWVLWSKLKASNNSDLYKVRKAARGFVILLFLLGGGYTFALTAPPKCIEFAYFKVTVTSTQGLLICFAQVFFSREVWKAAIKKLRRFQTIDMPNRPMKSDSNGNRTTPLQRNGQVKLSLKDSSQSTSRVTQVLKQAGTSKRASINSDQNHQQIPGSDEIFAQVNKAFQKLNEEKEAMAACEQSLGTYPHHIDEDNISKQPYVHTPQDFQKLNGEEAMAPCEQSLGTYPHHIDEDSISKQPHVHTPQDLQIPIDIYSNSA